MAKRKQQPSPQPSTTEPVSTDSSPAAEDNLVVVAAAITPSVVDEEKTPPPPTVNPRNEALSRLARASLVDTGNDEAIGMNDDESGTDPESRPNREAAAAAAAAEANEAATADEGDDVPVGVDQALPPPATTELPAKVHKVEVRGVVADVPEGEVIAAGLHALRHRGAAEMALREAHELLNRAKTVVQPAAPTRDDAPPSPGEDERRLAEALQVGTRDDAARAIVALRASSNMSEEQLGGVVARLVETHVRDALDHDVASKALETLVPEMLQDRRIMAILGHEERAARAAGDTRPYSQLYPDIGKKVRDWVDGLKGPAPAGSSPPSSEVPGRTIQQRTAAKAATPAAIPPKSGAPAVPTQSPVKTGSQIVAEMRAARGNPNIRYQRRI